MLITIEINISLKEGGIFLRSIFAICSSSFNTNGLPWKILFNFFEGKIRIDFQWLSVEKSFQSFPALFRFVGLGMIRYSESLMRGWRARNEWNSEARACRKFAVQQFEIRLTSLVYKALQLLLAAAAKNSRVIRN